MLVRVGEQGPETTVTDRSQIENALNNAGFAWLTECGSEDPGNPGDPGDPVDPSGPAGGGDVSDDPGSSGNTGGSNNADTPNAADEQTNPQTGGNSFQTLVALSVLMLGGFAAALFARRNGKI